jgi:hypothetical protein
MPGPELMLATSLDSIHETSDKCSLNTFNGSRALICCAYRGYHGRWLMVALNQRAIAFYVRVEKSDNVGFACIRDFQRRALLEQVVN